MKPAEIDGHAFSITRITNHLAALWDAVYITKSYQVSQLHNFEAIYSDHIDFIILTTFHGLTIEYPVYIGRQNIH